MTALPDDRPCDGFPESSSGTATLFEEPYAMNIAELVQKNRSCRRFQQEQRIAGQTLAELVDLGRLSASAANRQPLKYITSNDPATNEQVFSCLGWAAYLKDWIGPVEGERPAAYIVLLG